MGSGCLQKGKSWVATAGCTIFGGASFSLLSLTREAPGARIGTAGEGRTPSEWQTSAQEPFKKRPPDS